MISAGVPVVYKLPLFRTFCLYLSENYETCSFLEQDTSRPNDEKLHDKQIYDACDENRVPFQQFHNLCTTDSSIGAVGIVL